MPFENPYKNPEQRCPGCGGTTTESMKKISVGMGQEIPVCKDCHFKHMAKSMQQRGSMVGAKGSGLFKNELRMSDYVKGSNKYHDWMADVPDKPHRPMPKSLRDFKPGETPEPVRRGGRRLQNFNMSGAYDPATGEFLE